MTDNKKRELSPEEHKRIVDDIVNKAGWNKLSPEEAIMRKFEAIDERVKRLVREEYQKHGFINDRAGLQMKVNHAYYEELKSLNEYEMRNITASLLTIRALEDL